MPTSYLGHTIQNGSVSGPLVNTTATTIKAAKLAVKSAIEGVIEKADDQFGTCYTMVSGRFYAYQNNGAFASPSSNLVGTAGYTSHSKLLGNLEDFLEAVATDCAECLEPVIKGSELAYNMAIFSESHNDHICSECYMLEQSFEQECVTVQEACTYLERNFSETQTWNMEEGEEIVQFEFDTDCDYPVALLLVYLTSESRQIMRSFGPDEVSNMEEFATNNLSNLEEWGV